MLYQAKIFVKKAMKFRLSAAIYKSDKFCYNETAIFFIRGAFLMEYSVNPAKLGAVFMLPCEVVDKHIKLAGAVQLKALPPQKLPPPSLCRRWM